ncbi:MAG: M23 family metallopeptidase [Lachnospiraceae bacterium]|nr:M23 family metallopeptidase [Lachnospiraceae bacterium]
MARRNRSGVRKERIIMLASSVLVLTVLTVTGIFVKRSNNAEREDYIVNFEAIEKSGNVTAENLIPGEELDTLFAEVGTDDLDYDPSFQEANSQKVENTEDKSSKTKKTDSKETDITGKTKNTNGGSADGESKKDAAVKEEAGGTTDTKKDTETETSDKNKKKSDAEEEAGMFDESVDTARKDAEADTAEAISTTVQPSLDFKEEDGLVWPIVGDVLINYSMDKTIYFPTLQQYKYNPAIVIAASQGAAISAAANGRVTSVAYDPIIGNMVVMDLGNGYELTYGQLENITVSEGSYVSVGDGIGTVASPTKYYSLEGTNVYFKLTKDGEPVNPMSKLN